MGAAPAPGTGTWSVRSPAYKLPDFLFQRDVKRKHCGTWAAQLKKKEELEVSVFVQPLA